MTVESEVKDALGRPLVVGDHLAYAVAAGDSQVLNFYKLLEIKEVESYGGSKHYKVKVEYVGGHSWRSSTSKRKTSWLEHPSTRALKLEGPDLTFYLLQK
jgi:hypothetical protein